ncbi:MAG: hypothetical protein DMG76_17700 [Acidobacteria bacterium]|nr:MAG: hypothetical protein DMG76_17700 [Acidobacteriota bacterium]
MDQRNPSFLFLLILPAIGIALLWWNVLLAARARKYSGSYFEMDSLPFWLGQNLSGKFTYQWAASCVGRCKSRSIV